jgi:hypothetical protein
VKHSASSRSAVWHEIDLDYCCKKQQAGARGCGKPASVVSQLSLPLNRPTSGPNSEPGPLQRQMGKEGKHPSDLSLLGIDDPERERPDAAKRVVSGDREHASKARRRVMCSGERKRQQPLGKREPTWYDQDQDAGPQCERRRYLSAEPARSLIARATQMPLARWSQRAKGGCRASGRAGSMRYASAEAPAGALGIQPAGQFESTGRGRRDRVCE